MPTRASRSAWSSLSGEGWPDDPAPGVARRWERFLENLETHELGHITIALQGARAIDTLLGEGVVAATCDQAERRANRAASDATAGSA